jgi:hypothetical protein
MQHIAHLSFWSRRISFWLVNIDCSAICFQHECQDHFQGAKFAWCKDSSQITDYHTVFREIRADWGHALQFSHFIFFSREHHVFAFGIMSMNVQRIFCEQMVFNTMFEFDWAQLCSFGHLLRFSPQRCNLRGALYLELRDLIALAQSCPHLDVVEEVCRRIVLRRKSRGSCVEKVDKSGRGAGGQPLITAITRYKYLDNAFLFTSDSSNKSGLNHTQWLSSDAGRDFQIYFELAHQALWLKAPR